MAYPPNLMNSLRVVKGQSKSFDITISRKDGSRAKLSSTVKILFTAARGNTVFFTKTSNDNNGIEILDRENGRVKLTLEVADTEELDDGTNRYELWVDYGVDPPRREPLVENGELFAVSSVTSFDS